MCKKYDEVGTVFNPFIYFLAKTISGTDFPFIVESVYAVSLKFFRERSGNLFIFRGVAKKRVRCCLHLIILWLLPDTVVYT